MKIGLNIKLGIFAGLINCLIWYLVAKSLNFYSLNIDQYRYYATLILLVLGIFITVYFERKSNGGFLDFKKGTKAGVVYALILGITLGIFNFLYYKFIVPDAIDYFVSEAKKLMIDQKVSPENIAKSTEVIISYFSSFRMAMSTVIVGVIVSLLAGAVFRKRDPNTIQFSGN